MIAVVQRVLEASVCADGELIGSIGPGLAVLASIVRTDSERELAWMAGKLAALRIFRSADDQKHFDRDVREIGGGILLVSNFTVAAATRQGRRPSLDRAADPSTAEALFSRFIELVKAQNVTVATGRFGAEMKVSLINDGPATFIVDSSAE